MYSSFRIPHLLLCAMRLFVGVVFIYSGWGKLMSPVQNFIVVIEGYQFLKSPYADLIALAFPWLELIFGTFLALGFLSRISASVLAIFLTSFIILLARSLLLHLPISECGCFGSGIALAPIQAIILDVGLLLMSLIAVGSEARVLSLDQVLHK